MWTVSYFITKNGVLKLKYFINLVFTFLNIIYFDFQRIAAFYLLKTFAYISHTQVRESVTFRNNLISSYFLIKLVKDNVTKTSIKIIRQDKISL